MRVETCEIGGVLVFYSSKKTKMEAENDGLPKGISFSRGAFSGSMFPLPQKDLQPTPTPEK